jgi:hypothetical protein
VNEIKKEIEKANKVIDTVKGTRIPGSRRDRDRHSERDRHRDRDRDRDRSASPERRDLPKDVKPLTESDYFQKSDEFRVWLKEDKRKVSVFCLVLFQES